MASIHLVERLNNVRKVSANPPIWESGYWVISEETADRLTGADLYLHSGQLVASHFGGKILGYRIHRDGTEIDGRVVFRIAPSITHKGVLTGREGWGNEKKLVW
ncbi:hypothetical protein ACFQAT_28330 [Undibacterium arcticum]|uniref:Uncharacterized protein n=1 Tax=Undibacterium arcticum TaxID=1762892 RepID=A0ABV7FB31_9BURK